MRHESTWDTKVIENVFKLKIPTFNFKLSNKNNIVPLLFKDTVLTASTFL